MRGGAPDVDDRGGCALGFGWEVVAEDLGEERVHDGMEPFLGEPIAIRLGLPYVEITKAAFGALDREVHDQARGRLRAECVGDPLVERAVDRDILRERIHRLISRYFYPNTYRTKLAVVAKPVKRQPAKRAYDAAGRRAQSAETRQRIIAAARTLILECGYRATTIAAVARAADVNADTVYELVGRKPTLLRELIEQAVSGTDRPVDAEEREYVKAIGAARDPIRKLALYARAMKEIHARLAPLLLALRDASSTEPEAKAVWQEISNRRAANMRKFVGEIRDVGGLRAGLSIAEAADTVWVTNSPEVYVLLTVDRGWSPARYERWLAETWGRLLLQEPTLAID
jgi:AcrR family transcriptional regulator